MDKKKRVVEAVERNSRELVDFIVQLANTPSPTGEEGEVAELYATKLEEIGLDVSLQEVEPGRSNVIGLHNKGGCGLSLMFNGHFDTSISGKEEMLGLDALGREKYSLEELKAFLTEKAGKLKPMTKTPAKVEGDYITGGIGGGITNMKASDAAYAIAVKSVMEAEVELAGEVLIAGVVGEIEKAPVGRYQGQNYRGGGLGTRYLLSHGYTADMGIVGEPSIFRVGWAFPGMAFVRITTKGTPTHTASPGTPGINAIEKTYKVIEEVKAWGEEMKKEPSHEIVEPKLSVGAIEGGWPYKPTYSASYCDLYLDVRTLPGRLPIETKRELLNILAELKKGDPEFDADLEMYMTEIGVEIPRNHQIVKTVSKAHEYVFGSPPPGGKTVPARTDAIIMCQYGIPTINYGPGRQYEKHARDFDAAHSTPISDVVAICKVFALSILDVCTKTREDLDNSGE